MSSGCKTKVSTAVHYIHNSMPHILTHSFFHVIGLFIIFRTLQFGQFFIGKVYIGIFFEYFFYLFRLFIDQYFLQALTCTLVFRNISKKLIDSSFIITFQISTPDSKTTIPVIGQNNYRCFPVFLGKINGGSNSLVKSQIFCYAAYSIIAVCDPIDFTAFNHKKKAFVIFG